MLLVRRNTFAAVGEKRGGKKTQRTWEKRREPDRRERIPEGTSIRLWQSIRTEKKSNG